MSLKAAISLCLLVPGMAVSYYFLVTLPSHNKAVLEFERQKYNDSQSAAKNLEVRESRLQQQRRVALDVCLAGADRDYVSFLKENSTEEKGIVLTVPTRIAEAADRRKRDARNECLKRYGE